MKPPDKERFVQLIQENKGIIYKVCNSYCTKNERDDLAQEIIYQLWKSFPQFDPGFKFSTWMYRIALNVAISFYRKENRSVARVAFSENMILFEEQEDEHAEIENNLALLLRFINELKEIDRSIMLLYLEDKGYKEIAEITGISLSNVATRINRIKEKLRSNFLTIQNN